MQCRLCVYCGKEDMKDYTVECKHWKAWMAMSNVDDTSLGCQAFEVSEEKRIEIKDW